jgi:hypothetical protein
MVAGFKCGKVFLQVPLIAGPRTPPTLSFLHQVLVRQSNVNTELWEEGNIFRFLNRISCVVNMGLNLLGPK